jgi:hypothetical protein
MLLAIQHERPTTADGRPPRWLLKSPQHLEQFGVLAEVFGDATVVVTHRDPTAVTVSFATMVAYAARMHARPIDPARVGRRWADRLATMLDACVRDRDRLPADRSLDVRFDEFMADDLAMARRIYRLADQPITPEAEAAWSSYLAGHARGRLGRVDYRAADVGLDLDQLSARFAAYRQRFGV